ncbi:RsmB/NOP family class I SAM-dependent RNA methyltransferase [Magnetovibrio sp.]|uniref:RsmB/NOP family class I SAM-dependent RNA methyltransferase n=1 Tax=Magnetovibrio sp. TaxID=2024836 RepID=UPI002F9442CC
MLPAARTEAAIYLLGKITDERRPADDIVRAWFQARRFVGSKDRRAIRERVYGVLRALNRLDWHLGDAEKSARTRVLAAIVLEGGDAAANFDGSPHGPAPLNDSEQLLVDVLTGKQINDPAMPGHVQVELPEWLADKLKPVFGETFMAEMTALNQPAPMDLRVALGRVSRDQAKQALAKGGIKTDLTPLSPMGLRLEAHTDIGRTTAFRKGFVEVQDEGSQILSLLVGAKANMHVLDYCAGAGGKTLAIADRLGLTDGQSSGKLVATDVEAARLERMDKRLARAKLGDKIERHVLSDTDTWAVDHAGTFDRVLVDAPCTGAGTWRRHPEQKKRLTSERLSELMAMQSDVLNNAAPLVKPGGRLIYATCSLLAEENEQRVEAFLESHPNFQLLPIQTVWAETLKKVECPDMGESPYLRLTPYRHGTDGFFVAVMARNS